MNDTKIELPQSIAHSLITKYVTIPHADEKWVLCDCDDDENYNAMIVSMSDKHCMWSQINKAKINDEYSSFIEDIEDGEITRVIDFLHACGIIVSISE